MYLFKLTYRHKIHTILQNSVEYVIADNANVAHNIVKRDHVKGEQWFRENLCLENSELLCHQGDVFIQTRSGYSTLDRW